MSAPEPKSRITPDKEWPGSPPEHADSGVAEMTRPFLSGPTYARTMAAVAMDEARAAGLLDGPEKDHISVRVPRALLGEARRQTGIESGTELVTAALALAAQSDPVVEFMEANYGILGKDFQLEY